MMYSLSRCLQEALSLQQRTVFTLRRLLWWLKVLLHLIYARPGGHLLRGSNAGWVVAFSRFLGCLWSFCRGAKFCILSNFCRVQPVPSSPAAAPRHTLYRGAHLHKRCTHTAHTHVVDEFRRRKEKTSNTQCQQIVQSYSPSFGWSLRCRQWSSIFSINFAALGQFRPLACAKAISISKCISPLVRLPSVENPP